MTFSETSHFALIVPIGPILGKVSFFRKAKNSDFYGK